jgi:hypothetical protein
VLAPEERCGLAGCFATYGRRWSREPRKWLNGLDDQSSDAAADAPVDVLDGDRLGRDVERRYRQAAKLSGTQK